MKSFTSFAFALVIGLVTLTGCDDTVTPRPEVPPDGTGTDVEPATPDPTLDSTPPGDTTTPTPPMPTEGDPTPGVTDAPDVEEQPATNLPQP